MCVVVKKILLSVWNRYIHTRTHTYRQTDTSTLVLIPTDRQTDTHLCCLPRFGLRLGVPQQQERGTHDGVDHRRRLGVALDLCHHSLGEAQHSSPHLLQPPQLLQQSAGLRHLLPEGSLEAGPPNLRHGCLQLCQSAPYDSSGAGERASAHQSPPVAGEGKSLPLTADQRSCSCCFTIT